MTVHIRNITEHIEESLQALHDLYTSSPHMAQRVDVHLVLDNFDRQFNTWRNIARFYSRTEFVMMLDIDFYLCTDFQSSILSNKLLVGKLREGKTALVVPAFEYTNFLEGTNPAGFPRTKRVGDVSLILGNLPDLSKGSTQPGTLEAGSRVSLFLGTRTQQHRL